MKLTLQLFLIVLFVCGAVFKTRAQVGIGTTTPNSNAVLELKSPGNNQGFLVPRLTTAERTAIIGLTANEKGLLVFDTNDNKFYYWSGTVWIVIEDSVGTGTVTNIATGAGLTGGPITVNGTLSLADNGVTTIKINNDAVTSAKILDGTITSSDIADGTVSSTDITDGTVATIDLANSSVTDAKIGTGITVSKLSSSATAGQVLTTVGTTTAWSTLPDASATNEIQDLSLTTNTLSLSGDATTVNLAPYLDNTDSQNLTLGTKTGTQQPVNISGGTGVTIDVADNDNSITNEIQDLSLTTNTLSLSGDATTVSLAAYLDNTDNQDLALTGNTLSLTNDASTVSLAAYLDNTDAQSLTFTSPNLSISGGNSVNLSGINTDNQDLTLAGNTLSLTNDASTVSLAAYLDNTDSQDLTLAGNTLSLSGDATSVSLATFLDNTDAQNLTLGTRTGTQQPVNISGGTGITIDVADNDNSTTNEIQDLSLTTNTLSLSGDATTVSLAAYLDNTDAQNLTLGTRTGTQQPVNISGGTSVTIDVADNDNSVTNEIQDLSLTGNTLSLSGDATTVSLATYLDNTDAQTLTFTAATSSLAISGGNTVTVSATGTAGGDLNGSYPNPTVDGLQGRAVAATLPTTGQVLEWNGTAWAPNTDDSGSGGVGGSGATGQVAYWSSATSITGNSNLFWDEKNSLLGVGIAPKAGLHLNGSHAVVFTVAKDGAYALIPTDYIIICAAGTTDILLPDAAEIPGRMFFIRATDPKAVTIRASNGKDTIDGQSILQIADTGDGNGLYSVILISIGTDKWLTLNRSKR